MKPEEKEDKPPYAADHEHKFVRTSRYIEECVAGDGCRLGRMSREWLETLRVRNVTR